MVVTNREVIQRLYDAFAARDAEAMVACLDDDVEWVLVDGFPYGGTHRGPQAVLDEVWRPMATEWKGWTAIPDSILVDGDHAAVTGTYTGTFRATGKAFRARFAHVFALRSGRICRMEQFVDAEAVHQALT